MSELSVSPLAPKTFPQLEIIDGVELAVASIGFKYENRLDFFVAKICDGASVSGVFTKSLTRSSAVDYSREVIARGGVSAIAVNSGNSNAFTGSAGVRANKVLAEQTARLTDSTGGVITCSTGVIGEVLDTTNLEKLGSLQVGASWLDCATAIGTTDTFPKGASRTCKIGNTEIKISGIAKGSGMIAPDMATMLAYIFTDANIEQAKLDEIIKTATGKSFNSITVDGDTSTSDSVILVATGRAGNDKNGDLTDFEKAVNELFIDLAQQIVKDGEGATKFITVNVTGADSQNDANLVALSIANSPLVKTAMAGEDANWGRVVMAVGKSGANADRDKLTIAMGGIVITENGEGVAGFDESKVTSHLKGTDIVIDVNLNMGGESATIWTCDLTHGYISINADYRS